MTEARDYRDTVFLPKTDFPMKAGLPQKEPAILARWQAMDLYARIREARAGREKFILHDGPPYANGDMHIGHALNHILKDMVVRTQTLLGKDAPYVPGWDCHGLPIEWKVEEEYRKKKKNKDEVPAREFRAECRAYAQNWVNVQREQLKRLGVCGNWDKPYLTMDFDAEATIVSELLKFAESGQLYRGAKPVMWSPVEKTALAEAEVEYEDIVSTQVDVAFEIIESPIPELVGAHAVIWTTTPWTIPVNQALAYGPEVEYTLVDCFFVTEEDGHDFDGPAGAAMGLAAKELPWFQEGPLFLIASALIEEFERRLNSALARLDFARFGVGAPRFSLERVREIRGAELAGTIARHPMANLFRHPGESRGPASSPEAGQGSGTPDQVRGDEDAGEGSVPEAKAPLPFRGGDGGGGSPDRASAGGENPHPNPSPEGEGLSSYDPSSPLAEFFLRPRPFLPGDFVTTESGTGLVHMAPDHGEDDFLLCKQHGIDPVFAVEGDGKYRADWAWLGGQGSVINPKFNAPDGPICSDLRAAGGLLSASTDYRHSYPHSWRSKAKVIFRCTPQWFVPMDLSTAGLDKLDPMLETNGVEKEPFVSSSVERSRDAAVETADIPLCATEAEIRAQQSPPPTPPASGRGTTLRETALAAIAATRFVPEKGRNRIGAMVEGRPDWVLSRQRAWGVPITLFVNRKTGQYLNDSAVNARIVAAIRAEGVDAWHAGNAQAFLGDGYRAEDYEQITDILDVWFDSGSTHAFVLESGKWPELLRPDGYQGPPADLYLEGSDQHRGWFQSSLLESCGTRGRAPYKAVLTHGFTMDAKGEKMSKSKGNTVSPLDVMRDYGADIIRLWALSVDYTEDHRIGPEILKGVADQYRKLRNTFRYLLGALEGYGEGEAVDDLAAMPELERYMLALLAKLDAKLRRAVDDFDFNSYIRELADFCNEDLSAFFFDIRKDSLYCDAPTDPKRRAYRTVLDTLFQALIRYAAPVLVYTAEEVWGTRYPDGGSVHLLEWPELPFTLRHSREGGNPAATVDLDPSLRGEDELVAKWDRLRRLRSDVNEAIEPLRREKVVGSSLQAEVRLIHALTPDDADGDEIDLPELFISAAVNSLQLQPGGSSARSMPNWSDERGNLIEVRPTTHHKCGRCWRHLPEVSVDGALCARCETVVAELESAA